MSNRPTALAVDLGGTNIRLAQVCQGELLDIENYRCRQFASLPEALQTYLEKHDLHEVSLCLAVASPVQGDRIQMTNLPWHFSQRELKAQLGLRELLVINDYTALAMGIPALGAPDLRKIGGGSPAVGQPAAVCGPGTGLGVAHLLQHAGLWLVLSGEGGHVDFAPTDELEQSIHNILRRRYEHVSAERILSGPGIEELYQAICEVHGTRAEEISDIEISSRAQDGSCACCRLTLERFCALLGSFCGNLALTLATFGGVYVAGGIIPSILDFFEQSDFRKRFEAKGRYHAYNAAIPTYVITADSPGLRGAAAYLQQHGGQVRS